MLTVFLHHVGVRLLRLRGALCVPQPAETVKEWVYSGRISNPGSKCASWAAQKAAVKVVKEANEANDDYVERAGKWRVDMLGLGRRRV